MTCEGWDRYYLGKIIFQYHLFISDLSKSFNQKDKYLLKLHGSKTLLGLKLVDLRWSTVKYKYIFWPNIGKVGLINQY